MRPDSQPVLKCRIGLRRWCDDHFVGRQAAFLLYRNVGQ